jgi:putative membrane protein
MEVFAMKKVFIYGTVMMALSAAPTWAQQPQQVNPGSQGATAPAAGARAQQQNADHDFILEAAMGGMAEVDLGQLASTKAQSDQVKQFAQRMVTDHGKSNAELKALAQSKNVAVPADSGAQHKAMKDRLTKLSGAEFDRAYMQEMVSDHRKTVDTFRKESQSGKDAEVRAWAAKTLPTLEEHLQMAQRASSAAVGTSGTTTGSGTSGTTGSGTDRGTGGTGGTRGTTGDTARPGAGSGAGGSGTSTGTGSRPGSGSGGATDGAGSGGPGSGAGPATGSGGSGTGTTTPR